MTWILVAVGAAAGSVLRYLAGVLLDRPGGAGWAGIGAGTLAVNVVGSGILGMLMGSGPDPALVALLGAGFCGGLTTYSTFAHQTWQLIEQRAVGRAVASVSANLALGLVAVSAGWMVAG